MEGDERSARDAITRGPTSDRPDELVNRVVGHYRITARLGAGGMGEVYLAVDTRLDRPVAVKWLPPGVAQDAERLRRFHAEAKAASSLNHPHILVVHDYGDDNGRPYMVTEFVEGGTLRDRLRRGPVPWRGCATVWRACVARAPRDMDRRTLCSVSSTGVARARLGTRLA